jgi:hypothetical protein
MQIHFVTNQTKCEVVCLGRNLLQQCKCSCLSLQTAPNYSYLKVLSLHILLDRAEIIEVEMTCGEVQPAAHHTH